MKTKVYILHGWSYSKEKWIPFLKLLEKENIEPIMLDIPGLTANIDRPWNIDDYIKWLEKSVHDEKEKLILLGHSNGGRICLAYTLKHQEKIKQLILIDSAGIYHNELPLRLKRFVFGTLAKLGKQVSTSTVMRKIVYKLAREHDYENANPLVKETMRNLIAIDFKNKLENISVPTTIIWGESDKVTPLSDGEVLQRGIKNADLHIITDGRHSPMFTHPVAVSKIVIDKLLK